MRTKIYNGFMFYKEFDMLDIRLAELWDVVDKFILVECPQTHRNGPKPLYFLDNKAKYEQFESKLVHVIHDLPSSDNAWDMENEHRRGILKGCNGIKSDDYLIITDADEIPRAEAIRTYRRDCAALAMNFYYYYYNLKTKGHWSLAKMVRYGSIDRDINDYRKQMECDMIYNAGWHFSKIYSLEQIQFMFKNCLADDLFHDVIIDSLSAWREAGETHWCGHDVKFDKCDIDDTYPRYFLDNIERFKPFIK